MGNRIYGESVKKTFDYQNAVYIVGWKNKDKTDYILEELQDGSVWLCGEEGTFVSDSNIEYSSPESYESYLRKEYVEYAVFEEEWERDNYLEENGLD